MSADNKVGVQALGPSSSRRTPASGVFRETQGGFAPDGFAEIEVDRNSGRG